MDPQNRRIRILKAQKMRIRADPDPDPDPDPQHWLPAALVI